MFITGWKPRWSFTLPDYNIGTKKRLFTNALLALVFAYYYSLLLDQVDLATFEVFRQHASYDSDIRSLVQSYVMKQLKPFCILLDQFNEGCEEWYPFLIDKSVKYWDDSGSYPFQVQIFVFHQDTGTLLAKYPHELDISRRQLFLSGKYDSDNSLTNLQLILNLTDFFKCFGLFCFFCEKFFKGRGSQHKCSKILCCFVCKRPFLEAKTYTNKFTKVMFCDSSLIPSEATACIQCNLRIFSPNCKVHHEKKSCRFGWLCKICEKYTYCSKYSRKIEDIKKAHECGTFPCHFCGKNNEPFHQCQIQTPSHSNFMTKLAFIDMQKGGNSTLFCKKCYEYEKNKVEKNSEKCLFCADNENFYPNIACLLYEQHSREKFHGFLATDFGLTKQMKDFFEFQYLPKSFGNPPAQKRSFFQQVRKNRINKQTFANKSGVVEQILNHIFVNELFHTTYISHDDKYCSILEEILRVLLIHGIVPKVVGASRLWLIEIPDVGIRFISSLNYIEGNVYDICRKIKEPLCFFPHKWNKKTFYTYEGVCPSLSDYFDAEDSDEIISEKKKFCMAEKKKKNWNFKLALRAYAQSRVQAIAKANLFFLKESFDCQELLQQQFNINNAKKLFIVPFNPPVFTRAGYAFQLLLHYSNTSDIRCWRPPVSMASSQQELEYCGFLRWQNPERTYIDAWSPQGQKRFKESFPDSYCKETKTANYFNGCLVHGHPADICQLKRKGKKGSNYFKVPFETAFRNHEKKLALLITNHSNEVKRVNTEWECGWRKRKKNDKDVKTFMKQYLEPPTYRLDVRAAVRGGLNEVYCCFWIADEFETPPLLRKNENFYYTDMNSSYPSEAAGELPLGEYEVCRI